MKKGSYKLKNIVVEIVFVLYFFALISVSTLILNRNEYGVTQFGDKTLVVIDDTNSTDVYKNGQLVVVENRDINKLNEGDEVFIYKTIDGNSVTVVYSKIKGINEVEGNVQIVLENRDLVLDEEVIVGEAVKAYSGIGSVLSFLQNKWVFFILFIIPCLLILIYLVYSVTVDNKGGIKKELGDKDILDDVGDENENIEDTPLIVEAKDNEPAMVKADDFGDEFDEADEVVNDNQSDSIEMKPIVLDDISTENIDENLEETVEGLPVDNNESAQDETKKDEDDIEVLEL